MGKTGKRHTHVNTPSSTHYQAVYERNSGLSAVGLTRPKLNNLRLEG